MTSAGRDPMPTGLDAALETFILEHEYYGELDSGVEADRVWMTCTCSAGIARPIDERVTS